jgi:hypothetical protein
MTKPPPRRPIQDVLAELCESARRSTSVQHFSLYIKVDWFKKMLTCRQVQCCTLHDDHTVQEPAACLLTTPLAMSPASVC